MYGLTLADNMGITSCCCVCYEFICPSGNDKEGTICCGARGNVQFYFGGCG